MSKQKKDYTGFQIAWNMCIQRYLFDTEPEIRFLIVEDFHDSLVDIKQGEKEPKKPCDAIKTRYEQWEQNEWIPLCKKKRDEWARYNPFQARVEKKRHEEYDKIKRDCNHLRYSHMIQFIQDSSIGLGSAKERGHYELSGYMGEPAE